MRSVRIVHGSPDRWVCHDCGDGGTAFDLLGVTSASGSAAGSAQPPSLRSNLISTLGLRAAGADHDGLTRGESARRAPRVVGSPAGCAVTSRQDGVLADLRLDASTGATVGDLANVWGRSVVLSIDGVVHPATTLLAGTSLGPGSIIELGPTRRATPAAAKAPAVGLLRWTGGLDAGTEHLLRVGRHVLGSSRHADLRLEHTERTQALVEVRAGGSLVVHSLGTTPVVGSGATVSNAVMVEPGGWLSVGTAFAVFDAAGADAEDGIGSSPGTPANRVFNRPPRSTSVPAAEPIEAPCAAAEPSRLMRAGSASIMASLLGGLVVTLVFHQPLLLLMAAIGALGVAAAAWQQRRGAKREQRHTARQAALDLARFEREVVAAHRNAVAACHRRCGPADAVRIARGDARLWERRPGHDDAFRCVLGLGDEPWRPPLSGPTLLSGAAQLMTARHRVLTDVPCTVDLTPHGSSEPSVRPPIVGLVGPRPITLAIARSLVVQAATFHGPADLSVAIAVADDAQSSASLDCWRWVRWMPHATDDAGEPLLAQGERATEQLADRLVGRPLLLVVDGAGLSTTCNAGARPLLSGRHGEVGALVLAERLGDLPAICTTIVEASVDGSARWWSPGDSADPRRVEAVGMSARVAEQVARDLGRFRDPELVVAGADLPTSASLLDLLGRDTVTPDAIAAAWSALGVDPLPRAPIARSSDGAVVIDLDRDGPHALVAGTTGSGKSELLRTLVASFAVRHRPDDLTFVLIDYKGGSAFDACSRLPHVVGMVTDLDDDLARRALESLEAEVRHRERLLREVGAPDLASYRLKSARALPRLIVVVDEFATLAAELPDFLVALVGVAQRGRSLGIHLVLATQRPGGAVSDDIRANTNLRLALRVHDAADSIDVIADPSAASLHRRHPGRAFLRLGPGELVALQAARITGPCAARAAGVIVHERVGDGWLRLDHPGDVLADHSQRDVPGSEVHTVGGCGGEASELDVLVDAVCEAHRRGGRLLPRRPWLSPLPANLSLASIEPGALGVVDEPSEQRQPLLTWRPSDGNLLLVGAPGSGTTAALASLVLALDAVCAPDQLHLYVLDHGAGRLAPLVDLAVVGAVVTAGEPERETRLVRTVAAELVRRRSHPGDALPDLVLVIDGLAALRASWDDPSGYEYLDALERIAAEGAEVAIRLVATCDRPGALPMAITGAMADQWLFPLADRSEGIALGVPLGLVPSVVGRAVQISTHRLVQVADPGPDLAAVVRARAASRPALATQPRSAAPIGVLPVDVTLDDLGPALAVDATLDIPIGIADHDLSPVVLRVHPGDHVLVAGPPRSGKTTLLVAIASQLARTDADVHLVGVSLRRSALAQLGCFAELVTSREQLAALAVRLTGCRRAVVVIDDADGIDDVDGTLARMLSVDAVSLVVAGRPDALRSYGHWTQGVRRSRLGVLLRPQVDIDGDLLGVTLPRRRPPITVAGRGFLVADGIGELAQFARVP